LLSWIRSNRTLSHRRAFQDPEGFRRLLLLPGAREQRFVDVVQPWQQADFAGLDPAWIDLAGMRAEGQGPSVSALGPAPSALGPPPSSLIRRAYIERPRGHSKTSDMAVQIAWILIAARQPVIGLAAAADRDQANLIHDALRRLATTNPSLLEGLRFVQHQVRNPETGSRLEVISSNVSSSYGVLPDFIVCDELCHWEKPEMWYSLVSSAAKKPQCVLTVLTNAGIGRGWQWEVREHARTDPRWYFSSLNGPQAPWITDDWLAEQQALLPEPVFERLWLNVWQSAEGTFVTLAEAEECRSSERVYQLDGQPGRAYVAAIDYAEKHDLTVGCVCHREGDRIVVDRMDVVKPTPRQPTQISWVEDWIEEIGSRFPNVSFVIDEYQLLGTIQRLEHVWPIRRFPFKSGAGNHRLAVHLRQLIVHRQVTWYPDCGAIPGPHRDDLETELASLLLKQSISGRVRIDHRQDGHHHDDRSFTLGAACLMLCDARDDQDFLLITPPSITGNVAW
jgi:hypothetical protein